MEEAPRRTLSGQACSHDRHGGQEWESQNGNGAWRVQERSSVFVLIDFFFSGHMNDRAETGVMQERHKGVNEGLVTAVTCQRHVRTAASISDRFPE